MMLKVALELIGSDSCKCQFITDVCEIEWALGLALGDQAYVLICPKSAMWLWIIHHTSVALHFLICCPLWRGFHHWLILGSCFKISLRDLQNISKYRNIPQPRTSIVSLFCSLSVSILLPLTPANTHIPYTLQAVENHWIISGISPCPLSSMTWWSGN